MSSQTKRPVIEMNYSYPWGYSVYVRHPPENVHEVQGEELPRDEAYLIANDIWGYITRETGEEPATKGW